MHDRTIEKNSGCYNCIHFENGELAAKRWKDCRARDTLVFKIQGKDTEPPYFQKMDALVRNHQVGICLADKTSTDFVEYRFECENWSGRPGFVLNKEQNKTEHLLPGDYEEFLTRKKTRT